MSVLPVATGPIYTGIAAPPVTARKIETDNPPPVITDSVHVGGRWRTALNTAGFVLGAAALGTLGAMVGAHGGADAVIAGAAVAACGGGAIGGTLGLLTDLGNEGGPQRRITERCATVGGLAGATMGLLLMSAAPSLVASSIPLAALGAVGGGVLGLYGANALQHFKS